MQYNPKLHQAKNWQEIGCKLVSFSTFAGSFFLPIKPGEIPIARIAALVASGATLAVGVAVKHSKQELDRQLKVIKDGETQVFVHAQSMTTGFKLELVDNQIDAALAEKMGVSADDRN